jgi:AcrR family transcriptional regulator
MKNPPKREQTRDRILAAAIEVFAHAGIAGATTREIARTAAVNEVTLFRQFHSKEQLLKAAIDRVCALQIEALSRQAEWTQDLTVDLMQYAILVSDTMEANEDLIRVFIGESKRHPDNARQILQTAFEGLRDGLIEYLRSGQQAGTVRRDLDLKPTVDLFTGMLLAGMLRRSGAMVTLDYDRAAYLKQCVDLFVRGVGLIEVSIEQVTSANPSVS